MQALPLVLHGTVLTCTLSLQSNSPGQSAQLLWGISLSSLGAVHGQCEFPCIKGKHALASPDKR